MIYFNKGNIRLVIVALILLVQNFVFCQFGITQVNYSQNLDSLVNFDSLNQAKPLLLKNPVGKEFWLCFQRNYKETGNTSSDKLYLELFITGDYDARVKIEIPGIFWKFDTLVPGQTIVNVKLPVKAELRTSETNERLSVHIVSDNPISVYALNRRYQTTDTYLGLPIEVLGYQYRAMCFSESQGLVSQIAIVATENNTRVSVVPSVNTDVHPAKIEFEIILNKGDVYQIFAKISPFSNCDLTGTLIKANKKIAVFSGHQCSYVPQRIIACNHLVEQMPPIPSWGRHFYLGNFHSRNRYTYRVLAHKDDTKVFENNKLIATLKAGEYFEKIDNRNLQITASQPILVAQYSHGFADGDSIGDPMMILISPTQQFLRTYRFATPVNGSWNHFINVVVPTESIGTLRLDGKPLSSFDFHKIGISRYSIGQIKVPFGSHTITGDVPFGMYSYGFGYKGSTSDDAYDAYGTMGGQSFIEYDIEKDTLAPMFDVVRAGDSVGIIIRDDRIYDSGLREVRVVSGFGIEYEIEKIVTGMPQASVKVMPRMKDISSNLVIEAIDVALNKSVYTVCYNYLKDLGEFNFSIMEGGDESCKVDPGLQIGVFGSFSANMNYPNFSESGDVRANGKFGQAFNFGGIGGFIVGRNLEADQIISARLSIVNNPAELTAPDSLISKVRDLETGELKPFQEQVSINLHSWYMNLTMMYEYYLKSRIYFVGGLTLNLAMSKSADIGRKILIPEDFSYGDGRKEKLEESELKSLTSFNLGLVAGVGFNYNVDYNLSIYSEVLYNHYFSDLVNDAEWRLYQFNLNLGFRYRFFIFD